MRDVRTISDSPQGRVAMNRAVSALDPEAVARSLSLSAERLVRRVVVKVSAHLKVAIMAGRCIVATALRAGWGVAGASALVVGSSLRISAVRVEIRILEVHAVLRPALSIIAALALSSLDSNAVGNIVAEDLRTSSAPCISLSRMACAGGTVAPGHFRVTAARILPRPFTGGRKDRMARRR